MKRKKWYLIVSAAVVTLTIIVVAVLLSGGFGKNNEPSNTTGPKDTGSNTTAPEDTSQPTTNPTTEPVTEPTTPAPTTTKPRLENFDDSQVKALYVTGSTAASSKLDELIKLVDETELNALVIDAKEWYINFDSDIPEANEFELDNKMYNAETILKKCHDKGIYVIARIVVFRDNLCATRRPEMAIKTTDGKVWKEGGTIGWTNPYNEKVWDYNIAIAKEAVSKGFDEIQFDYVRFPTGTRGKVDYGTDVSRTDAVTGFLKKAVDELHPLGVKVSADIFGIVIESGVDGRNIGQELEKVGLDVDYISPMLYPSHYANDSNGSFGNGVGQSIGGEVFKRPDLEPYKVIYNTLTNCKNKLSAVEGYRADVRPYLQAFTLSSLPDGYYQTYGPEEIREQIQATYDAGYKSWILWNPKNNYPKEAFLDN
ncbi:MAG: putative glycoside hydrolase [Eubacteriales bacterium]|nr:putative glycoside hydrolase [Eubacteriales bacterium]